MKQTQAQPPQQGEPRKEDAAGHSPLPWEVSVNERNQWDVCEPGAGDMIADLAECGEMVEAIRVSIKPSKAQSKGNPSNPPKVEDDEIPF